jgi:hypothetical protein
LTDRGERAGTSEREGAGERQIPGRLGVGVLGDVDAVDDLEAGLLEGVGDLRWLLELGQTVADLNTFTWAEKEQKKKRRRSEGQSNPNRARAHVATPHWPKLFRGWGHRQIGETQINKINK